MKRLRSLQRKQERHPGAFFTSVVLHVAIFAIVFATARQVAKVAAPERKVMTLRAPPPPPPPPPKGGRKKPQEIKIKKPDTPKQVIVPVEIPKEVIVEEPPVEEEVEEVEEGVEGGVEGGVVGGVVGGVIGGVLGGQLGGQLEDEWDPNQAREITVGVTPPKLIKKTPPEYPQAAARRKIEGEVVLRCIINLKGDVKVEGVVEGDEMLANAASRAVERWKYEPAIYKDRPQSVYLIVRMTFKLPKK